MENNSTPARALEWRFIPLETRNAYMNMALDEACANEVALEHVSPTIRFYRWEPSAVSIGYFQGLEQEVDVNACRAAGVDIVRRRTGGGAVYHDYEGEITYSVIAPAEHFSNDIIASYKEITGWIVSGLKELNINAEFVPINDLIVNGQKISGNAQTRRNGILQMHGTILCDVNVDKMFSLLRVPDEKMRGKTIEIVKERVTSLKHHGVKDYMQIYHALTNGFLNGKKWKEGTWTNEELERAEELANEKYGTARWIAQR